MEKINMYAIYDVKSERYDTPVFMPNDIFAKRWFYKLVYDGAGQLEHFKNDFELHRILVFNVLSGKVELPDRPKCVIDGKQIGKEIAEHEKLNEA